MIVAVLRPDPARTADRIAAMGYVPFCLPLFAVSPVDWTMPEGDYDAVLLTSGNAIRYGGAGLDDLKSLPVLAVGTATAAAARSAGFDIASTGERDAAAVLAESPGFTRILHVGGRDRTIVTDARVTPITVYRSDALDIARGALDSVAGCIALLHSVRAACRFAELIDRDGIDRAQVRIAAISPSVLAAAGSGWDRTLAAPLPRDDALVAMLATLAD